MRNRWSIGGTACGVSLGSQVLSFVCFVSSWRFGSAGVGAAVLVTRFGKERNFVTAHGTNWEWAISSESKSFYIEFV